MHGHMYRHRSPQNIVEEFEYIVNNFPEVKEVVIEDDTFTADVDRVKEFCHLIREKGIHKKKRKEKRACFAL